MIFFYLNEHKRRFFYLQFTLNAFQITFEFHEVIFYDNFQCFFVKYTLLFILGARFSVYHIDVLGAM